jgi:hypothetical protein
MEVVMRHIMILLGLILCLPGHAWSQAEPPGVSRARAEATQECRDAGGGRARFTASFLRRVNLSPDGVDDFIIDNAGIECPGALSYFCGTGGCGVEVHVSTPSGHRRVFSDYARAIRLEQGEGRQLLVLDVHGTQCGQAGAAPCLRRYGWNGSALVLLPGSPANRR